MLNFDESTKAKPKPLNQWCQPVAKMKDDRSNKRYIFELINGLPEVIQQPEVGQPGA